jgi:2,4-dienoyl-CoA reductase-like NADH-dependent reductase (Old Yellow Enzyme family)
MSGAASALLRPGRIGGVETRNRLVRSATSETMADEHGRVNEAEYRALHLRLARGGVGLQFTGHCYVHPWGKYAHGMTGLDTDANLEPLSRLTAAVGAEGGRIFAQLNHAGAQARAREAVPLAPSAVPNPQHGRVPQVAEEHEIEEVVAAFAAAARRVKEAGFDGVHIHAGHGYLLSEFLSPVTNRRTDRWGGPLENRQRLLREVVGRIRGTVGPDFPLSVKLGMRDFVPNGLTFEDALETATALDRLGVDAIEVSGGLTSPKVETAMPYAGLTRRRALEDKVLHRLFARYVPEAYFREEARGVKQRVRCPVLLVGGLRSIETMESVVADGSADFVSLARPLIREPELVREIERGRRGVVDCVSCNICILHEGVHPLRCWRTTTRDLLVHAAYRFSGRLH